MAPPSEEDAKGPGPPKLGGVTVTADLGLEFDNSFVRDLVGLYEPWRGAPAPAPELLVLNEGLAAELGADPASLRSPAGVEVLSGRVVPPGAEPVAQAYSGHQFGGFSPRLGDGRALLVGELIGRNGRRRDLHLKGSGRTPFSRGGDGKAAVGPMLREYLIGESLNAIGIPTTRALAVVATGERIMREGPVPGAVLARVAASHIRVGTFEYAAAHGDADMLRRLADHAMARHHPAAREADNPYLALLDAVVEAQAALVAKWMLVGFVHGVMNTDNMTISGESLDFGPCAFLDAYDPATVFSSIDHGGRYAYGNQPGIAQWNLARLAEAMLALIDPDTDKAVSAATEVLGSFVERFHRHWAEGVRAKLGLVDARPDDDAMVNDLLKLLERDQVDFTSFFRALSSTVRGDQWPVVVSRPETASFEKWTSRWRERLAAEGRDPRAVGAAMDRVNPMYVPRNHLVERALDAAGRGDLGPLNQLLEVLAHPYDERPGLEEYATPSPPGAGPYVTYCGT